MSIFSKMKKLFSSVSEQVQSMPISVDKWGDPWLDPRVDFGNNPPDLAACQRRNSVAYNKCPHCGQEDLRLGPTGPGSQNLLCASCGSKFNEGGVFGVDLLRDCTNPIPEMSTDATHGHFGLLEKHDHPFPKFASLPTDRRGAIAAQKARRKNL